MSLILNIYPMFKKIHILFQLLTGNKRIHPLRIPRLQELFLFLSRQGGALSFHIRRWKCLIKRWEGYVVSP